MCSGSKIIVLPSIRQAPFDRARSRKVRSEIAMPRLWKSVTHWAGVFPSMISGSPIYPRSPSGLRMAEAIGSVIKDLALASHAARSV